MHNMCCYTQHFILGNIFGRSLLLPKALRQISVPAENDIEFLICLFWRKIYKVEDEGIDGDPQVYK